MNEQADPGEITQLIQDIARGEAGAQRELVDRLYAELKQSAKYLLRAESEQSLQPTVLVHEAYLRLFGRSELSDCPNRAYFFAAAARAMRRVIVDEARRRNAVKRGGRLQRQPLSATVDQTSGERIDLIELDRAIDELERLDARQAEVVHLRWFANLTVLEVAQILDVSKSTVEQDWRLARAFLQRQLKSVDDHFDSH